MNSVKLLRLAPHLIVAIVLAPLPAVAAEGVTNFLRSITGAVGGKKEPVKQTGPAATLGVRGMDDGQQQSAAAPSSEDYNLLEGWVASSNEATNMAKKRELVARRVTLRTDSPSSGKDKK